MKLQTEQSSRYIKHEALKVTVVSVVIFLCHMFYLMLGKLDIERHAVQIDLDLAIPFIKEFVIPYMLWYVFVIGTFMCYLIHEHKDLIEIGLYDIAGLVICCVIFVIYPTEVTFRPEHIAGNDIFSRVLQGMFDADGPYSVIPSMHCYESTVVFVGIMRSRYFSNKTWAKVSGAVLMAAIWMSTMFIKQHSILDVIAGIALALALIPVIDIVRSRMTEKGCN